MHTYTHVILCMQSYACVRFNCIWPNCTHVKEYEWHVYTEYMHAVAHIMHAKFTSITCIHSAYMQDPAFLLHACIHAIVCKSHAIK